MLEISRYMNSNFAILLRDFDPETFPKHEPEPDSPEPDDPGVGEETADLVRPVKT
ncbi:MAG: hypothetical protein NVS1B11_02490 [Terriglobales bacterium]